MNRKELLITGVVIVLGLLVAFPLTRLFIPSASRQAGFVASETSIHQVDDQGNDWVITPVRGRPVVADPNAPQAKPVIVVKTDVRLNGREALIGLILQDRDGRQYQPIIGKGGVRQPAPRLRIVDEAGKVVLDDSFQYG
jgi:hypothetical protein